MLVANLATLILAKAHLVAFWMLQAAEDQGGIAWDPWSMLKQMGWIARIVVVILFIMSAWSIGVMIDRFIAFSAARKQSRQFAPAVAGALREGKLDEAIRVAERNKKSHLAKVVTAGLQEFKAHGESNEIPGEQIEASKRALERAEAIVHAELKRGLGGLGNHRLHGPVRWTVRNGYRNSGRFPQNLRAESYRSGRGRRRYFRSPGHHGPGTFRRHSRGYDVQLLHRQSGSF